MKNKEGYYLMIKESIHQEDITFLNIYAPNLGTPKNIKQILKDLKGEIDSNTILLGTCTPHLHQWLDHPDRKSIRTYQP